MDETLGTLAWRWERWKWMVAAPASNPASTNSFLMATISSS
jgi:hypothetical protein